MHTHLFASQNAFVLISNGEAEQKICIFWSNTFPCFQMDRVGTKHRVKPLNSLLMSHWLISSLSMAQKSYRHVSSMAGIVLSKHIWKGRKMFVCYVFGMICVECKWRIHNWVCRSSKAFEVFLWPKPASANRDQLSFSFLSFPHRDLLRLNLARNSLNEVPSEALLQLKNLNQLELSFNKIRHIEENTFAGRSFMRHKNYSYWIHGLSQILHPILIFWKT